MTLLLHNGTIRLYTNKMNIGGDIEPSCTLNIEKPSSAIPTLSIERTVGKASLKSTGNYFMIQSASDYVGLNYFSDKDVSLTYGGGNVCIGNGAIHNITSYSDLTITGTIKNDDWTNMALTDNWVNFGGDYPPLSYFRDKNGMVYIRGYVKSGDMGSDKTIGTLPIGFRPSTTKMIPTLRDNSVIGTLHVNTAGRIIPMLTSTVWTNIGYICFKASGY